MFPRDIRYQTSTGRPIVVHICSGIKKRLKVDKYLEDVRIKSRSLVTIFYVQNQKYMGKV